MHAEEVLAALPAADVPGAVVGVRHHGTTSLAATGVTEPGGDVPLRADAVVRLSSNTKPLVAALTLLLVADGLLALDEPVDRLLPELAGRRVLSRLSAEPDTAGTVPALRPITVEDLLTMRMGFGFVPEGPCPTVDRAAELGLGFGPPDPRGLPAPDAWLARCASLPLLDQPGTAWRYELSFAVLGVLLARAAGRPLGDVLRDRLLAPLGMTDTGFVAGPERLVPAFVRDEDGGLALFDGVAESRWLAPPTFPDGRGGLVGTAADLLRFAGMLLDDGGALLDPAAVALMTTDHLTPAQRAAPGAAPFLDGGGWGFGVGVVASPVGTRYGWAGGLGTLWYSWPGHDLAAVLVTQVLPPTASVFGAFTRAIEDALAR
ncbi:serine hydrolase [Actinomycetospora straminea]|uniref:Serine hydrolase n=1 Tax=Actinomycetospora straminea TaxID=663607 RepID=A0ABP9F8L8_9PSEU